MVPHLQGTCICGIIIWDYYYWAYYFLSFWYSQVLDSQVPIRLLTSMRKRLLFVKLIAKYVLFTQTYITQPAKQHQ